MISTIVFFIGETVIAVMTLTHPMETTTPNYISLRLQLIGYCIKKTHDKNLAEDLAQEALTRYFATINLGKTVENTRAWLFHVLRNLIADEGRSKRHHCVGHDWGDNEADPNSLEDDDGAVCRIGNSDVSQCEVLAMMPRAVSKLGCLDRQYLNGYYRHGKSFKEFSCNEGISLSASKGRMFRARHRLREQIEIEVAGK